MDALRCPPRRRRRHQALGRRAAPRGAVPAAAVASPTCCCSTSRPTISTPNRWPGWSGSCRTTRAPSWRSPTTATSSTTSRAGSSSSIAAAGIPCEGNYSGWLEQKHKRLEQEEKRGPGPPADAGPRAGVDRPEPAGAPGQVARRASRPTRSCWPQARRRAPSARPRSSSRPGPRLGDLVIEAERPARRASATGC